MLVVKLKYHYSFECNAETIDSWTYLLIKFFREISSFLSKHDFNIVRILCMKKSFQTNIILINGMATNNEKQRTKGLKQYDKAREKIPRQRTHH